MEERKGFLTAREKRGLKTAGLVFTYLAVGYVLVRIWPLPQFFGHRSFWRLPTNVAAEKPVAPSAPPASGATLDSIAKDLTAISDKLDSESFQIRYDLNELRSIGQFPWLYVTAVDEHSVQVSPSKLGRPVEYFETGKVVFVSFAEKAGGVARRLTEEDVNNENLLLSVVAWGREKAEKSDGYVNGLILADVGPPTTSLSYQVKVNDKILTVNTTVGERCQRLVGELLAKEKKKAAE